MEELGLSMDFRLLLLQAVGFFVVFLLLRKYLFGPVGAVLTARETEVAENLRHAEDEKKKASQLKAELEAHLAFIHQEARQHVGQAMAEAAEERERMLAETRAQCEQLLNRAREQIKREQRRALVELRGQLADLTVLAASRALQANIDGRVHQHAIEDFIEQLEAIS